MRLTSLSCFANLADPPEERAGVLVEEIVPTMADLCTIALLLLALPAAAAQLYKEATFAVHTTTNITYAQGLTCTDGTFPGTGCTPMDLQLDVYEPVAAPGKHPLPLLKPACEVAVGQTGILLPPPLPRQ